MHRQTADRLADRTALRCKRAGQFHDVTWRQYRLEADRAAAGLVELGIQAGDRVGLLSENRPEWLVADVAILSAGAADVPIHAPSSPPQVQYQLSHSGSRGVIVSGQSQADKVLSLLEQLPGIEFLISFDPVDAKGSIRTCTWSELLARGESRDDLADEVRRRESRTGPGDLATIIYTSGTTGRPKGVMLTHGNLTTNAQAMMEVSDHQPDDVLLSWLPYSHIYARTVDHYSTVLGGTVVALAESVDTLVANLSEVHPTWMTAVPRFYEKVWAAVENQPAEERKKTLASIFGPRIRWLSSGGAPLPKHIGHGFHDAGIKLLEGYGLTESSPVISFNRLGQFKIGTVGLAIPGVEVRIAADGEILTRGPHVMKGYWKDPEATAAAVRDGWLYTGDVGMIDDEGFLSITDRKKDLIITSGGKNVAPSELERLLTSDPYIDQAVVYGDRKPFPTAILVPHFAFLEQEARRNGWPWTPGGEWIDEPAVMAFLQERVDRLMQELSQPERVKKFLVRGRPFRQDSDELTATLKIRRRHIIQKFQEPLDALYAGPADSCDVG
jgi:long-chain acyl-CoA synthetase